METPAVVLSQPEIQPVIFRPNDYKLSLAGQVVDTQHDSAAGWRTPLSAAAMEELKKALAEQTATRRVYPLIIQFDDVIQQTWKTEVEKAGIKLIGYLPENSFLAEASLDQLEALAVLPHIQWMGPYKPAYKLSVGLGEQMQAEEKIPVIIQTFAPNDVFDTASYITATGGTITESKRSRRWGLMQATIPASALNKLAHITAVQWIEPYQERILLNNIAVAGPRMNVTNVWATHHLTGTGQIIGHADSGLDIGTTNGIHPDFSGRIKVAFALGRPNDWSDPNGHGTHTAGSVLGMGTASSNLFKGVAHEALLVHQSIMDAGGGLGGLPLDIYDLFLPTYTNGARIHSDSWGTPVYGQYTLDSRSSDEFTWDFKDMLIVTSAGNSGRDGNNNGVVDADSMGAPGTAKNILSVGASESLRPPGSGGYSGRTWGSLWPFSFGTDPIRNDYPSIPADGTNQGMAGFSSRGPTDDGRIKPDIMAPGTDIVSCKSRVHGVGNGWGANANTNYVFMGGTSMACPLTAGAAALVRQFYADYRNMPRPSAALVKGTMINGARSITPGQYGTNLFREIPALPRPNNVEGWGQVNLEDSLFPPSPRSLAGLDITNGLVTGETNSLQVVVLDNSELRFTLVYSDYPATAGSGKKLINDLDLLVVDAQGSNYYPNGFSTADHTNNTETIDFTTPTPGHYTVHITACNIPEGPQPYALIVSGNIHMAPEIVHTPLQNQYSTNIPYMVEATITAPMPVDTNQLFIFWNTTGSTSVFTSVNMVGSSNDLYRGFIPAQPIDTDVYYYLSASTNLDDALNPPDAPGDLHHFRITHPFTLNVGGIPYPYDHPTPAYGLHTFASGYVVNARTDAATLPSNGTRYACSGWIGTADVPASGSSNAVSFTTTTDSFLIWNWNLQYELTHQSIPAGILTTSTWWNAGAIGQTVAAEEQVFYNNTNQQLASWYIDGLRWPDLTNRTDNPATSISMTTSRMAVVFYLPAGQDSETNGLMDWWEMYYFGATGQNQHGDMDGDSYDETMEFLDRTDPRDPLSHPVHPGIDHTPLMDPQVTLAPYPLAATITDNYTVVHGLLWWQRNYGAWTNVELFLTTDDLYTNSIPAPGTNSDHFAYYIEAYDNAGLGTTTTVYSFDVLYPRISILPEMITNIHLLPQESFTAYLQVSNGGLNELYWQLDVTTVGLQDDVENGTNGWQHNGRFDLWHIETNRAYSGSHSWYNGLESYYLYINDMDTRLITPEIGLGARPQFSFRHWTDFEYDTGLMDGHYWDSGIMEISTNGGVTFEQITPVGGYPGKITDNPSSPFAPETPCFGNTSGQWQLVHFDLTDYAWQHVQLAFHFGSDSYTIYEGWYIDDVRITGISTTNDWISFPETNGTVSMGTVSNISITISAATFDPPQTWEAFVALYANDPVSRTNYIPIAMHLRPYVELIILGSPEEIAYPTPYAYGTNYLPQDSVITNDVDNPYSPTTGTRYICTGWTGTGSMPTGGPGNEVIYTATSNASLTWYWELQYLLTIQASNAVIEGLTSGWHRADWLFDLIPRPDVGYLFQSWQKNLVTVGSGIPLSITSDAPWSITAQLIADSWDISATGTITRTGWRIIDTSFGTFEICNPIHSGRQYLDRFVYAMTPSTYMTLRYPDGTTPTGKEYLDITTEVEAALLLVGNHDNIMDPGECVDVGEYEFLGKNPMLLTNFFYAKSMPVTTTFDTDKDDMDNAWEDQTGLNKHNPSDALLDQDSDGVISKDEYIADTHPFDPHSYLHITQIQPSSDIVWIGGTSVIQYLEGSMSLENDWMILHTNNPPTSITNTQILLPDQTKTFYRIRAIR